MPTTTPAICPLLKDSALRELLRASKKQGGSSGDQMRGVQPRLQQPNTCNTRLTTLLVHHPKQTESHLTAHPLFVEAQASTSKATGVALQIRWRASAMLGKA